MLEIRYSARRETVNDIADISGSWKDFEILHQQLLKFLESNRERIFIEVDKNINSEGWDFILESLEINQNGDAVKVSVIENKTLKVKGSKGKLEVFAAWLEFDEDIAIGYHSHYEYFEGNKYIDSESTPLIIRIK